VRRAAAADRNRRAGELLDLIGLSSAANRYPHQLSGGQQQRVALARALAIQPSVLLLDEPLSALDAKVRVQLRDEIRRIQTQLGTTTLFVTHDQEEALSISDRVVVLSHGKIEQVGTPSEIYGNPRTVFVAQFVGTMNRIEGTVVTGGRGLIESRGTVLHAAAARDLPGGARVLLLIRPEAIAVEQLADGAAVPDDGMEGQVRAQIFLGSVTRLTITTPAGELMVDTGSAQALTLSMGTRVRLTWDPEVPRLISLDPDDGAAQATLPAAAAERSAIPL
jgi:putative spermidine/putrescine transport system ATP-binding protein